MEVLGNRYLKKVQILAQMFFVLKTDIKVIKKQPPINRKLYKIKTMHNLYLA